ncbi:MAG: hypothetical protein EON59_09860 [Alphaproteobacteria bacterium]|nr:MAG: hypothetical protein EON59_09860 [Alphaproteobacteria bacterium]
MSIGSAFALVLLTATPAAPMQSGGQIVTVCSNYLGFFGGDFRRRLDQLPPYAQALYSTSSRVESEQSSGTAAAESVRAYRNARQVMDRRVADQISSMQPSAENAAHLVTFADAIIDFSECMSTDGERSLAAERLRARAPQFAPVIRQIWAAAAEQSHDEREFMTRTREVSQSRFFSSLPGMTDASAAWRERRDAAVRNDYAERRAHEAAEAEAVRLRLVAEQQGREAAAQARETARLAAIEAERRQTVERPVAEAGAVRAGRRPSPVSIYGQRLGSYPTPEALRMSAAAALNCPIPSSLQETVTGNLGDRSIRYWCGVGVLAMGSNQISYTLGGYALRRITYQFPRPGVASNQCVPFEDEMDRHRIGSRARSFTSDGWEPVQTRSYSRQHPLGWQLNYAWRTLRKSDVTLDLYVDESESHQGQGRCFGAGYSVDTVIAVFTQGGVTPR